jgi:hypothetical protein
MYSLTRHCENRRSRRSEIFSMSGYLMPSLRD